MKVLLIRPRISMPEAIPTIPLGLGYLAAAIRKKHTVKILDYALSKSSLRDLNNDILNFKPDVIGITSLTPFYPELRKYARFIKKIFPEIVVVLGGIHVSNIPYISILETHADIIVIGEGENSFSELMDSIEKGFNVENLQKVNGIVFRNPNFSDIPPEEELKEHWQDIPLFRYNEQDPEKDQVLASFGIIQTPDRELIEDLDSIPEPAWDLISPLKYPKVAYSYYDSKYPVAIMLTTRGCPFSCTFCASTRFWGHEIRARSAKNIVDEMEFLIRKYHVRQIDIWDDNLTSKPNHLINLCKEITRRKLIISLKAPNGTRLEHYNQDMLDAMKNAGFNTISLAIESANQDILDRNLKRLNLKLVQEKIKLIKNAGFFITSSFIFGLPGETITTARKTIEYARNLPIDTASFFIATPLPGSKLFGEWSQGRNFWNYQWEKMGYFDHGDDYGVSGDSALTSITLKKLQSLAYRRFFFHPKRFIKNIFERIRFLKFDQIPVYLRRLRGIVSGSF